MADFDWRQVPEELLERYGPDVAGYAAWRGLLGQLDRLLDVNAPDPFLEAFDAFLEQLRALPSGPGACRIFVSHQRRDVPYAERIAWRAQQQGFEYWLDVHDPLLQLANRTTLPPVVQAILIAAIIEMALLNCSHGITVQTAHAQASRWVPYEFGRAKQRWLVSTQVASWFDNGIFVTTTADYLKLGACAHSESAVVAWLAAEHGRCGCARTATQWRGGVTLPLPN
jgi:hypothetical protein